MIETESIRARTELYHVHKLIDAFTAQHLRDVQLWEGEKLVLVPQGNVS